MDKNILEYKVKSWLKIILKIEHKDGFQVTFEGNTEKGDGFSGQIFFVKASQTTDKGVIKNYDLILKVCRTNRALREKFPLKEAYLNEIYFYNVIIPAFIEFQQKKGLKEVFNSVPQYYGHLTTDDTEVVVLENLKKYDYRLWDKKYPLPRNHIDMVVRNYAKFHAISIAFRDQDPVKYEKIVRSLRDISTEFAKSMDSNTVYGKGIEDVYELFKDDFDETTLTKWRSFKGFINHIFLDMVQNHNGMKLVTHGDCWNNNFMYKYSTEETNITPTKVAILDWQFSREVSPVVDLSHFLFSCISKDDLEDLDTILIGYHKTLSDTISRLGSDPVLLYPVDKFLDEWRELCKLGILMSVLAVKFCTSESDELRDVVDSFETQKDSFSEALLYEVKNKTAFKERMGHIVKYAVERCT